MQGSFAKRLVCLLTVFAVVATSLLSASPAYAAPGDCDGTPADDAITCSSDPTNPDDIVGLGLGDDTYVQEAGVTSDYVGGDALEDGTESTGNGGDDHITIEGKVTSCVDGDNVDGDGGNDTIVVNGEVQCVVTGDYVNGKGGNDQITINGEVGSDVYGDDSGGNGGNDTITVGVNGFVAGHVIGDFGSFNGGDDIITINGEVSGEVYGDDAFNRGGNDTIIINGIVGGNVYADVVVGIGGDDRVELGPNADIAGVINGESGFDTLVFKFLRQSQLNGLDPVVGTLTYNGHTYNWYNFERLLGTLQLEIAQRLRTLFADSGLVAVDALDGVKVFKDDRLIAFISYASLSALNTNAGPLRYQSDQSQGWYVTVVSLGALPAQPGMESYQVTIFSPANVQAGQFTFKN